MGREAAPSATTAAEDPAPRAPRREHGRPQCPPLQVTPALLRKETSPTPSTSLPLFGVSLCCCSNCSPRRMRLPPRPPESRIYAHQPRRIYAHQPRSPARAGTHPPGSQPGPPSINNPLDFINSFPGCRQTKGAGTVLPNPTAIFRKKNPHMFSYRLPGFRTRGTPGEPSLLGRLAGTAWHQQPEEGFPNTGSTTLTQQRTKLH